MKVSQDPVPINTRIYFKPPVFNTPKDGLIDKLMDRVDKLHEQCELTDSNHIAVDYCKKRKIPKEKWDRLYHIDDISKIHQLAT